MACFSDPSSSSLVLAAVNAMLNDPSFTTGSEVAADALKAAKILKDWCVCEGNRTALTAFSAELVKDLEGALSTASTQNPLNREKIWRSFIFTAQELSLHGGCHFCAKQELFLRQHSTST